MGSYLTPTPQLPAYLGMQGGGQRAQGPAGMKPDPKAAQIAQGLQAFMTNYFNTKNALQDHYRQKVFDTMSQIQQGLLQPSQIDQEKIVRWMQKADLPLRTEAPTAAERKYQAQQEQFENASKAGANFGAPGFPIPPQSMGVQQPGAPPQPPRANMLRRMLGMPAGPASTNSPAGQWLNNYVQAAAPGGAMNPQMAAMQTKMNQFDQVVRLMGYKPEMLSLQQKSQLLGLSMDATNPDSPKYESSVLALQRLGMAPDTPLAQVTQAMQMLNPGKSPSENRAAAAANYLWSQFKAPMMMKMMDLTKDFLPRTSDPNQAMQAAEDLMYKGKTDIPFHLTMDEFEKVAQAAGKIHEVNPSAPWNLVYGMAYADAGVSPALSQMRPQLEQALGQFKTSGAQSQQNWSAEQARLYAQLNSDNVYRQNDIRLRNDQQALNTFNLIRENATGEAKRAFDEYNLDKSDAGLASLFQRLNSINNLESQVQVPIPGKPGQFAPLSNPTQIKGDLNWLQNRMFQGMRAPYISPIGGQVPNQQPPSPQNASPAPWSLGAQQAPPTPSGLPNPRPPVQPMTAPPDVQDIVNSMARQAQGQGGGQGQEEE